jgi:putative transcriptional regulator
VEWLKSAAYFSRELYASVQEMDEIARGERAPSREFHVDAIAIKELRSKIGLSQPKYCITAARGRCHATHGSRDGVSRPAKALLSAISKDPRRVLKALAT